MSWLSGGLNQFSNLTDQISSFTKEVLTETTEEVADPAAELDVLRQKHLQLQKSHQCLETELVKLREHSDEQNERAETAEYQISTISQEYRKIVESRDAEIRHLKTENGKLREEAKGFMYNDTPHPLSPLKQLAQSDTGPGVMGRELESVDMGGSGEWLEHYHEDFSDVITSQAEINQLRSELSKVRMELQCCKSMAEDKGLEASLGRDKSHHEQELASLQSAHQQTLQSLTLRHQQEIGQLQEQVDQLQQKLHASPMDYRTRELEELNLALVSQLNQLKSDYRKEEKANSEIALRLEAEEVLTSQLRAKIKALNNGLLQENSLVEEKEKMRLHINIQEMQEKISEHQKSMCSVQEQYERIKEESVSLQEQIDSLSCQLSQKDREISSLKVHTERLCQEGDPQFKEIMERKENELAAVRKELDNVRLQEGIMKAKCSQMEATQTGTTALAQVKSDLNYYKQAFEGKISELEEALASQTRLKEEIGLLKRTMGESKEVVKENKCLQIDILPTGVQTMEEERGSECKECQALQQQNTKYTKQLANLKDHLIEIQDQHTEEAIRADEREAALKLQLADLHDTSRSTETKLRDQSHQQLLQLKAVEEERDDSLLKFSNAQQQADMNAESIRNLQTVLEQFQRDQSSELGQALKKSQLELSDSHAQCQHLALELRSLQEQLEEAQAAAEVASILNQELEEKETRIRQLKEEGEKLHESLQASHHKTSREAEAQVDRRLMKNLVIGYVHATKQKKTEVLHLIAKILDFTSAELEQAVGNERHSGWLSGLWNTASSGSKSPQASLSQLFIKFLESESSPAPSSTAGGNPDRLPSLLGPATKTAYQETDAFQHPSELDTGKQGQSEKGKATEQGMASRTEQASSTEKSHSTSSTAHDQLPSSTSTNQDSFQSSLLKSVLAK